MRKYVVPPIPDSIWQKPTHFIAFGFGAGALPIAPGTFGTLMAIPFYLCMHLLPIYVYLGVLVIVTIVSMWLCQNVSKEIAVHDHQGMCLDEIVGFLVTMFAVPFKLKYIVLGFILFRLFDIWKPQPIRFLDEKIKGGVGMILDDVLAGIYSCIILHILSWMI